MGARRLAGSVVAHGHWAGCVLPVLPGPAGELCLGLSGLFCAATVSGDVVVCGTAALLGRVGATVWHTAIINVRCCVGVGGPGSQLLSGQRGPAVAAAGSRGAVPSPASRGCRDLRNHRITQHCSVFPSLPAPLESRQSFSCRAIANRVATVHCDVFLQFVGAWRCSWLGNSRAGSCHAAGVGNRGGRMAFPGAVRRSCLPAVCSPAYADDVAFAWARP